jgi:hypothetical protein
MGSVATNPVRASLSVGEFDNGVVLFLNWPDLITGHVNKWLKVGSRA